MSAQFEVKFEGHFGDDLVHVNAARGSFGRESEWGYIPYRSGYCQTDIEYEKVLKHDDERLLYFLARGMSVNNFEKFKDETIAAANEDHIKFIEMLWQWRDIPEHRSPFNHSFFSVSVKAPIYVARQLVKHEYMPWNEISGRYIEFKPENVYIPEEFRSKVRDKKQGSGAVIEGKAHDELTAVFIGNAEQCFKDYHKALELNNCEEQARGLLPLNLMTQWRWSGTFGAWAKMLRSRLASDAQKETQDVAKKVAELLKPKFPVSYNALVERKF